jgi:hypothetical protein
MGEQMRGFFSSMKRQLSRGSSKRDVRFDDAGFSVFEEEEKKASVPWSEVLEIFAYKLDLGMYDEICIGFRVDTAGTHWWVSEEFVGYRDFVEELGRRFPGIRTDWFSDVAFPAFVENRTTLWGEPWSPPQEAPIQSPQTTSGSSAPDRV